jgi:hypothetical protein
VTGDNLPPGFPRFQARMEAMIDRLGGDWLAQRACEASWHSGLQLQARGGRFDRDYGQSWHYGAAWTRFDDSDWDQAATYGENPFSNAVRRMSDPVPTGVEHSDGFLYLVNARGLVRQNPLDTGVGILLASAVSMGRKPCISVSDEGESLCRNNHGGHLGAGFRSAHRYCGEGREEVTLRKIAREMKVLGL